MFNNPNKKFQNFFMYFCFWALTSSLGEKERRHSVNFSDTRSQVEGIQQTCLFNNHEKLIHSPKHPDITILDIA